MKLEVIVSYQLDIDQLTTLISKVASRYLHVNASDCAWRLDGLNVVYTPLVDGKPLEVDDSVHFNATFDFEVLRTYTLLGDSCILLLAINNLPTAQLWNENELVIRGGFLFIPSRYDSAITDILNLTTTYTHTITAVPETLVQADMGVKEPNLSILISNFELKVIHPTTFYLRSLATRVVFVDAPGYWLRSALIDLGNGMNPYIAKVYIPPTPNGSTASDTSQFFYAAPDFYTVNRTLQLKYKAAIYYVMSSLGLDVATAVPIVTPSLVAYIPLPSRSIERQFDERMSELVRTVSLWSVGSVDDMSESDYQSVILEDGLTKVMFRTN